MKKLMAAAAIAALGVVPAQASGARHPANPHSCHPHSVGYYARGVLVSESLTQTQGTTTPRRGDDRYSGDLTVNVTRANHGAPTGSQTFTLTNARVKFYDADHNGVPDTPKAGDRVILHGKITKLNKHCDQTGFTPTITVRHVQFKPASHHH